MSIYSICTTRLSIDALRTYGYRGSCNRIVVCLLFLTIAGTVPVRPCLAYSASIAYAGFAYAGGFSGIDTGSIDARFKYSRRYEMANTGKDSGINAKIRQALAGRHYPFDLNTQKNVDSFGDEVLETVLVVTGETVSEERFGSIYKISVQVRAQALIFEYKVHQLRRAYPISFTYLDVMDHSPSESEIDERIGKVYEGAQGKEGIISRYADALSAATLPTGDGLFLKITKVSILPDAQAAIPAELTATPGAPESWLGDSFGEALNTGAGVPLFPYTQSYAVDNLMMIRLANVEHILKIPPIDYDISIELTGVKRVTYAENAVGASYVYGAYATIKISEHGGSTVVLDAQFKNGEVKVVPVTQDYVDDLPAYGDSIRGLFDKLGEVLGGRDLPWLKSAAVTPNLGKQIADARAVLKKCK